MKVTTSWAEVPRFENEEDEAQFWMNARVEARLGAHRIQTRIHSHVADCAGHAVCSYL